MMLFTDVLRHIRKGAVVDAATAKMADLVAKVQETGNGGSLTLKLTVKPKKGDEGLVDIQPSITVSMPNQDLSSGIFFIDADGGLTRTDPNQREMFGEADTAPKAVREA